MPYSLKLSDGRVVTGIPDDVSEDSVLRSLQSMPAPESAEERLAKIKPDYTLGESFGRAVKRGAKQLGSTVGDVLPALGASALGFDDYAKQQMEEARQTQEEIAATIPAQFGSYKDVNGVGDFVKYGVESVGEMVPDIAASLIPGGIGGTIARRAGVAAAGRAAMPLIESGATAAELARVAATKGAEAAGKGQIAGAALGSYAQTAPEIFQNIYNETGEFAPGAALLAGSVNAALDSVLPAQILNSITGPVRKGIVENILEQSGMEPSLVRSVTAKLFAGAAGEGATEGTQEAISIATEKFVSDNKDIWDSEDWTRVVDSSIRGAIGGGTFGAVSGVPARMQEAAKERDIASQVEEREQELERGVETALTEREQEEQQRLQAVNSRITESLGLIKETASPEERKQRLADLEIALGEYDAFKKEVDARLGEEEKARIAEEEKALLQQEEQQQAEWRNTLNEKLATPEGVQEVIKTLNTKDTYFPQFKKAEQNQIRTQLQRRLASFKTQDEEARNNAQVELEKVFAKVRPTPITEMTGERLAGLGFTERAQKELLGANLRRGADYGKLLAMAEDQRTSRAKDAVAAAKLIDMLPASITTKKEKPTEAAKAPKQAANENVKANLSQKTRDILSVWENENGGEPDDTATGASAKVLAGETGEPTKRARKPVGPAMAGTGSATPATEARTEAQPSALKSPTIKENEIVYNEDDSLTLFNKTINRELSSNPNKYSVPMAEAHTVTLTPEGYLVFRRESNEYEEPVQEYMVTKNERGETYLTPPNDKLIGGLFTPIKYYSTKDAIDFANKHFSLIKLANEEAVTPSALEAQRELAAEPIKDAWDNFDTGVPFNKLSRVAKDRIEEARDANMLTQDLADSIVRIEKENVKKTAAAKRIKPDEELDDIESDDKKLKKAKDKIGRGLAQLTKPSASIVPEDRVTMAEVLAALADVMYLVVKRGVRSMGEAIRQARKELGATANDLSHGQFVAAYQDANEKYGEQVKANKAGKTEPAVTMKALDAAYDALPSGTKKLVGEARGALSQLPDGVQRAGLGLFGLAQKYELYGKDLPSLKALETTLELRAGDAMSRTDGIRRIMKKGYDTLKKHSAATVAKFEKFATDTTKFQIEVLDSKDANKSSRLYAQFKALPKDLQDLYEELRNAYDGFSEEYINLITEKLSTKDDGTGLSPAKRMRAEFEKARLKVYLPLFRTGEYWLSYTDAKGERVVEAFESNYDRNMGKAAAAKAGGKGFTDFSRLSQITVTRGQLPTGFMGQLVDTLQRNNVDQKAIDEAYQAYISLFPAQSIRQQFKEREGVAGYTQDVMQVFASVGSRMANQLSNLKYGQELDKVMNDISNEAQGPNGETSQEIKNVVQDIYAEQDFLRNPQHSGWAQTASRWSYYNYIIGNVSSAIINLTNLPIMTYSILGGEYGWGKASNAMKRATALYMKGGLNEQGDWSASAGATNEIKQMLAEARKRAAIGRSAGYEIIDMSRTKTEDYNGLRAKVEKGLGWVFQNSEQMNREIGIISAYLLAKEGGMSNTDALNKAISTSTLVNGTALAETGPRFFQQGIGKVLFIFKRFAQAQLYMVTRLMHQAFKGESPELRRIARRQLLGIYATSFAFAGVQGMPFFGAGTVMAGMLDAMMRDEDDEPIDPDDEVRKGIGSVLYSGIANELLNADIASRTGFNNLLWRDDNKRLAEVGPVAYTLERLAGPAYSLALNYERAYDLLKQGHTERALEAASPAFIRNVFKATRFATEGATNLDGVPIVDDVSTYNIVMQIMGFSDADISEAYAKAASTKNAEKYILDRRTSLLNLAYLAKSHGDTEGLSEIQERIDAFNERNPETGIAITTKTLNKSYAAHLQRNSEMINGVYLNPKLRARLMETQDEEEEE